MQRSVLSNRFKRKSKSRERTNMIDLHWHLCTIFLLLLPFFVRWNQSCSLCVSVPLFVVFFSGIHRTNFLFTIKNKRNQSPPRQPMLIILLVCRSLEHAQKCNRPLISPRTTNDRDRTHRSVVTRVAQKHATLKKPRIFFNRILSMSSAESSEKKTSLTSCKSTLILHSWRHRMFPSSFKGTFHVCVDIGW